MFNLTHIHCLFVLTVTDHFGSGDRRSDNRISIILSVTEQLVLIGFEFLVTVISLQEKHAIHHFFFKLAPQGHY